MTNAPAMNMMHLCVTFLLLAVPSIEEASANSLQRAVTLTEPTEPLQFRSSLKKRPSKKNLKKSRLLRKMGADFKAEWMAIEKPGNNDLMAAEMGEDQVSKLLEQVDELELREELKEVSGSINVDPQSVAIFQQWLVRKSSCPVIYQWQDVGEFFWPRWIRQGSCGTNGSSSKQRGCSWPQGMQCVQSETEVLQILRWHCKTRQNKSKSIKKRKCKWYKVPYPVTTSCKCACTV